MPPKKEQKPSKKADEKKRQKVIEDKTFGLKNKKGAKMQKYIASVEKQVQNNAKGASGSRQAAGKRDEKDDLMDITKIFKPVQSLPKIGAEVDPKTIVCQFFKSGLCTKGSKCKFSHDLSTVPTSTKRNIYFDIRDGVGNGSANPQETNENWDEEQLTQVAEKKHGEKDRKRPNQTDIVCKFFLDAIESAKYGWFWECPNGEDCIYRHALPQGYVLKKDKKKMAEQDRLNQISLEELIETERAALGSKELTKVTLETFMAWKRKKLREKKKKAEKEEAAKRSNYTRGRQMGLSGRELFTFNPALGAEDDEEAGDDEGYGYEKDAGGGEAGSDGEDATGGEGGEEAKPFEIDEKTFLALDDLMDGLEISSSEDEAGDEREEEDGEEERGLSKEKSAERKTTPDGPPKTPDDA